ncbi:hypothetical protein [Sphingobium sp.]|nr:hypothetical protein [Sphingobium sp.]
MTDGSLVRIARAEDPRPIEFYVTVRAAEYDPLVLEIFKRSSLLNLTPN